MYCFNKSVSCLVTSDSLRSHGLYQTGLLCLWSSPGKNTGVGCHSLLQGIFLTQGSNPSLPHCRQILYHLSQGKRKQSDKNSRCKTSLVAQGLYSLLPMHGTWIQLLGRKPRSHVRQLSLHVATKDLSS